MTRDDIEPPAPITVRDADPSQEDAIRALSDATHAEHRARLPHVFDSDNAYQHSLLDTVFGPPLPADTSFRANVRVACRGDDLLGYVFVIWDAEDRAEATALIADIAIAPHARGTGVGKRLLADLQGQMEHYGWASLRADVWQDNAASHALFHAADFASERVTYRYGTPAPRQIADPEPPKAGSTNFWWIAIAFLVVIAIVASAP